MSVKLTLSSLVLSALLITSDGQTTINPTISNSSGDYFISQGYDFDGGEIKCLSTYCYIHCPQDKSCYNIDIDCKNAELCVIGCNGQHACSAANFYVSSKNTQITCIGDHSCGNDYWKHTDIDSRKVVTIYTDSINHSLSHSILTCSGQSSCEWMKVIDADGAGSGYVDASMFKIYCPGGSCSDLQFPEPYPLTTPSILNETGEYYNNIGSFVNIICSHNLLCSIDCSSGSCTSSYIHCNGSNICTVYCDGSGNEDFKYIDIKATNNDIFHLECTGQGHYACIDGAFFIENVKMANIIAIATSESLIYDTLIYEAWIYQNSHFYIKNVDDLYIDCDSEASFDDTTWHIINNTNVTVYDFSSLRNTHFNITPCHHDQGKNGNLYGIIGTIAILLVIVVGIFCCCYYNKWKKQKINKQMKDIRHNLVHEIEEKIPTKNFT